MHVFARLRPRTLTRIRAGPARYANEIDKRKLLFRYSVGDGEYTPDGQQVLSSFTPAPLPRSLFSLLFWFFFWFWLGLGTIDSGWLWSGLQSPVDGDTVL